MRSVYKLSFAVSVVCVFIGITGITGITALAQENVSPLLNEIMSSNSVTIHDEDTETSDWMELYNPGDMPIDLTGYGLTDDTENPYQWVFPAVTLHPREHKIVFASGKDRKPVAKHWETVVSEGDHWRYFEGQSEPPQQWASNSFDDTTWKSGPSGFGFGDGDDATVISEDAVSVYIRTSFRVEDVSNISRCFLHMDYDDGFVAYINGHEVARGNLGTAGTAVPYYQLADTAIEAKMYLGDPPELFELEGIGAILVPGENILAVQVHNSNPTSSDLSAVPFLTFEMDVPPDDPNGIAGILSFSIPFLHTNFRINKLGETITLFDPLGNIADQVEVSTLPVDFSFGRQPDGAEDWVLYATATPGTTNADEAFSGYSDPVEMSQDEGFYDREITVTMTTGSPAAEIHYTLDGTEPGRTSPVYGSPLSITHSAVVHARSFEDNKLPGEIATRTYIIGKAPDSDIKNYFITCDPADFEYLYKFYTLNDYMPATISCNGEQWTDAGLRIRGDDSRSLDKKSLKVKSDKAFPNGHYAMNFNAEYLDRTYVQQYLSSHLMRDSGQPVFTTEYARLYLNGEFLGLYLNVENVDEEYLSARDMDTGGNLYKATHDGATLSIYDDIYTCWEKKTNPDADWSDLVQLQHDINAVPDEDYYDFAVKTFDYEKMVNIIAMNMLISNRSTYYHNYYLYHDINGTNKWIMLPWDLDKTMGIYDDSLPYQQSSNVKMPDNPFLERALLDPIIFHDIRARFHELAETLFNSDRLFPTLDSLKVLLRSSVEADETDQVADVDAWEYYLQRKYAYIDNRVDILENQFEHWPRSFKVEPTTRPFSDSITLRWHPSYDPDGDAITYKILYSTSDEFLESSVTTIEGISDTTYTFPTMPSVGTYYWKVMAKDNNTWIEGFNSWNKMEVKPSTNVPLTIQGDVVLTAEGSPYGIAGDVIIPPESSLRVEAGTELIFSSGSSIVCNGELAMNGTADNPVIMRVAITDDTWGALCFDNAVGTLTHCVIRDASAGSDATMFPAAVSSVNSDLTIEAVSFERNAQNIAANGGSLTVRDCTFAETEHDVHLGAEGTACTIEDNTFGYCRGDTSIRLKSSPHSVLSGNTILGSRHHGIQVANGSSDVMMWGNTIHECIDTGITISGPSDSISVEHSLIRGCATGIAVIDGASLSTAHNTFYGNNIAIAASGGNETPGGAAVTVTNSIFSASVTADISSDKHSTVAVTYSLSDSAPLTGTGNITADPLFVQPEDGNFTLRQQSPAINAGDPSSGPDPDNTVADMGAFYYRTFDSAVIINEINYNSSDKANSGDWVELYNPHNTPVDLSNWQLRDENAGNAFTIQEGYILEADSYVVLCHNSIAFVNIFPDVDAIGELAFGLSGDGDTIILLDDMGTVVDSLTYDDKNPWPEECDGDGHSLSLVNPGLDNGQAESWQASKNVGTPGAKNDVFHAIDTADTSIVAQLHVSQNRPNPFNEGTVISYELTGGQNVRIDIFNVTGQRVMRLLDKYQEAGSHSVMFDASHLPSGIYIYRIETDSSHKSKKMALIK